MDDKQFFLMFGSIFGGIGSIFAIIGVLIGLEINSSVGTVKTQGTVIDFERVKSVDSEGHSHEYYYPIVSFTPSSGKTTTFESRTGSYPPAFSKGQQVEIVYNPQQPSSAMIYSWFDLWFLPTMFTGMGSIFALIGGIALIKSFPRLLILK
ncbi:hypothetical protein NOS3756_29760 [Nostoc sp. NIES-3756]|uniref:DUF3592 domain-containing protein n=1 Tax=Nostoc sp. NIES-3756 TaxID=1751286 RepID=UPI000722FE3E|nr:DUF3592 domain-containing protein [Nostoc sp. NIES-3756]BAT54012.1 hypothetical protein NOS3756_29760 [Nostoc sp. NIES-3756]